MWPPSSWDVSERGTVIPSLSSVPSRYTPNYFLPRGRRKLLTGVPSMNLKNALLCVESFIQSLQAQALALKDIIGRGIPNMMPDGYVSTDDVNLHLTHGDVQVKFLRRFLRSCIIHLLGCARLSWTEIWKAYPALRRRSYSPRDLPHMLYLDLLPRLARHVFEVLDIVEKIPMYIQYIHGVDAGPAVRPDIRSVPGWRSDLGRWLTHLSISPERDLRIRQGEYVIYSLGSVIVHGRVSRNAAEKVYTRHLEAPKTKERYLGYPGNLTGIFRKLVFAAEILPRTNLVKPPPLSPMVIRRELQAS
ncbi:uncharacterized protein BT62DRAFT_1079630 [Guyanagaster necrorhizus]|uniref:Uncharacterized protein n=1 Tax=Guyanagaster necrorhizus TaxID=856835 RepID=A0A9P7VKN6_9AGAR|nr:uncharacterized protein BT62DRAFT_1079630 [Guyanagaster necrorhizus MCA 3950]KAG7442110.1 hypothetical protein BT62DRAFT_1079630 [Guyanagaster necrorhizus MCA 3950]